MPIIDSDDIAEIMSDSEMDSVAINGNNVHGLFFEPYEESLGMSGSSPTFKCNPADIVSDGVGDPLVFNTVNYTITSKEIDNSGMVLLGLRVS